MATFLFRTSRIIDVEADTEEEADRLAQAELHREETITSVEKVED